MSYAPSGQCAVQRGGLHATLVFRLSFEQRKNGCQPPNTGQKVAKDCFVTRVPDADGSALLHPTSRKVARMFVNCILIRVVFWG